MINLREFFGLGYYISKLDRFIGNFRKKNKHLSSLQRAEIEKYQLLNAKRDHVLNPPATSHQKLWDQF